MHLSADDRHLSSAHLAVNQAHTSLCAAAGASSDAGILSTNRPLASVFATAAAEFAAKFRRRPLRSEIVSGSAGTVSDFSYVTSGRVWCPIAMETGRRGSSVTTQNWLFRCGRTTKLPVCYRYQCVSVCVWSEAMLWLTDSALWAGDLRAHTAAIGAESMTQRRPPNDDGQKRQFVQHLNDNFQRCSPRTYFPVYLQNINITIFQHSLRLRQ